MNQLVAHKDARGRLTSLINTFSEILPQVDQQGASINPFKECEKIHFDKETECAQLASKYIIIKRLLSYCRDDFLPRADGRLFLQKLRKCTDYNVKANAELEKLRNYIFDYGCIKDNLHNFNLSELSKYFNIMKFKEKLILKVGHRYNKPTVSISHHVNDSRNNTVTFPKPAHSDSDYTVTSTEPDHQCNWMIRACPPLQQNYRNQYPSNLSFHPNDS